MTTATLFDSMVARLASGIEPAEERDALPLTEWVREHRPFLKEGVRFDLKHHEYLRAIYACTAREMAIYKAGQVGASEYLINFNLHACDERDLTSLYVFPTETHIRDFSRGRIGPGIEASPYLRTLIGSGAGRYGTDQVGLKRVGNRFLYLRGAKVHPDGSAPQLKSVDADTLTLDEIDEMDQRAPEIAKKRLGHSAVKEVRWASTPTYANIGIHRVWLQTDQREWIIQCGACGQHQRLTIDMVVTEWDELERPVHWHGKEEGRAYAACRKCGAELDRTGPGEWVPRYPDRDFVGFHPTKLHSAQTELLEIVEALDTVDETKRKETINQDLAEPYVPRGGALTDDVLDKLHREYALGHHPAGERCYMGIDVGKVINVIVRGRIDPETGEWPLRWASEEASFEDVIWLAKRFDCKSIVVDAQPETRKAREFQKAFKPGIVWICYYSHTAVKDQAPVVWDYNKRVVRADRTRTLDETHAGYHSGHDYKRTLPADIRAVREYYLQLKANVRTTREKRGSGELEAVWVPTGPDHYSHAENYCTIANMRPKTSVGRLS